MDSVGSDAEELDEEDQWVDADDSEVEMQCLCINDAESVEENLSNTALSHGFQAYSNETPPNEKYTFDNQSPKPRPFTGIRLETFANQRWVISIQKYESYCKELSLPRTVKAVIGGKVRGISGTSKGVGEESIQIPFRDLSSIADVNFLLIECAFWHTADRQIS